jgi:hypothetical protein
MLRLFVIVLLDALSRSQDWNLIDLEPSVAFSEELSMFCIHSRAILPTSFIRSKLLINRFV